MYELINALPGAHYLDCPARIGIVETGDREVVAIDGGSDKDAGKKLLRALTAQGWHLKAVYNTHAHADHTGGNAYLQAQTQCAVYTPELECDFARHPILEPATLTGGDPLPALRHKFLMAQPSDAQVLKPSDLPDGMEMIPLPGHSPNMTGYRTANGAVYLGDALAAQETLDKYGVSFLFDVQQYLDTLEKVKAMRAERFIPSHAPVTEDIAPLAEYNIRCVYDAAERIETLCKVPSTFDQLLKGLLDGYGLTISAQQYALVGATLRSYLTWLTRQNRVEAVFEDNYMLWRRIQP